jgi:hypothetical protein
MYALQHSFTSTQSDKNNDFTQLELIGINHDVEQGMISYRRDGTFSNVSKLSPEAQENFTEMVAYIESRVKARYGQNRRVQFVPYFSTKDQIFAKDGIFDFITVVQGAKFNDISNPLTYLCTQLAEKKINPEDLYVLINTAPFFDDEVELADTFDSWVELKKVELGLHEGGSPFHIAAAVDKKFKFFRSSRMSPNQMRAIVDLNLALGDFHQAEYPIRRLLYSPMLYTTLPLVSFSGASVFAALVGLPWVIGPLLFAFQLRSYEVSERDFLAWYLHKISAEQVQGVLTHLLRWQDHEANRKAVFNRHGITQLPGSTVFETLKGFVETEIPPLAISTKAEFVESLVQKCYQILTDQNCAISPDPYEVYKDEEGFDYIFMK